MVDLRAAKNHRSGREAAIGSRWRRAFRRACLSRRLGANFRFRKEPFGDLAPRRKDKADNIKPPPTSFARKWTSTVSLTLEGN